MLCKVFAISLVIFCAYGTDHLSQNVDNLIKDAHQHSQNGKLDDFNKITETLLKPNAKRVATEDEAKKMTTALLKAELYRAFYTEGEKQPRMLYDFFPKLGNNVWNDNQRAHFTVVAIFSLAAQEYFWNPKSTVDDLKNRVIREFRYSLYHDKNDNLFLGNKIFLEENIIRQLVNEYINSDFRKQCGQLYDEFLNGKLGDSFVDLKKIIDDKFAAAPKETLSVKFAIDHGLNFQDFYIDHVNKEIELVRMPSYGDGLCGFYSMYMENDSDGCDDFTKGNQRYRVMDDIEANYLDKDLQPVYFSVSKWEDFFTLCRKNMLNNSNVLNEVEQNIKSVELIIEKEEKEYNTKKDERTKQFFNNLRTIKLLNAALDTFGEKLKNDKELDTLEKDPKFQKIIHTLINLRHLNIKLDVLLKSVGAEVDLIIAELKNDISKRNIPVEHYKKIGSALKEFINSQMLPGAGSDSFNAEELLREEKAWGFLDDVCKASCALIGDDLALEEINNAFYLYEETNIELKNEKESLLNKKCLELIDSFPESLRTPVLKAFANDLKVASEDQINGSYGWLEMGGYYVTLEAVLHNENIFGVSEVGQYVQPLEIKRFFNKQQMITKTFPDQPQTQTKYLATVNLISRTAKNIFLYYDGYSHYEKLILPNDYSAMAAAIRHENWMNQGTTYANYP